MAETGESVVVPRVPTIQMLNEGWRELSFNQGFSQDEINQIELGPVWSAMIAAAPPPVGGWRPTREQIAQTLLDSLDDGMGGLGKHSNYTVAYIDVGPSIDLLEIADAILALAPPYTGGG